VTRVFHLRNSDRFGGPERLILDQVLAAGADTQHIVASFGTPDAAHPFLDRARAEGVETCLIPQSSSYDPRAPGRVRAAVRQLTPDVVVGHDYKANIFLALATDRPRVAVVHGYTSEDSKIRMFEAIDRRVVRSAEAVVVVSDVLRAQLLEAGVPPERIHEVPNGVNADRIAAAAHEGRASVRAALGLADEVPLVLVLGRLSPEKGQDTAIDAFAALGREDVRLLLVGDGASREALELRAASHDLSGRVLFAGWRDDPWACLGAADLFLLPSRSEGLPLALLEALATGVPVVATRVGAVAEVLEDGGCGLVIEPDEAADMTSAIRTVLDDEEGARARANRGARRVREAYSVGAQARRLEAIYASLA